MIIVVGVINFWIEGRGKVTICLVYQKKKKGKSKIKKFWQTHGWTFESSKLGDEIRDIKCDDISDEIIDLQSEWVRGRIREYVCYRDAPHSKDNFIYVTHND